MLNVDFVRFTPPGKISEILGLDKLLVFSEDSQELRLLRCETVNELISGLKKPKKGLIGVLSSDIKVNREAVMRKKVDLLFDSAERKLDYATFKLAAEKDVTVELSLYKFLEASGIKRMKLFEETAEILRLVRKFETPFILTSGASKTHHLRPIRQIYDFFYFMGADIEKNDFFKERLVRRLENEGYIADDFEIESA
ncbi:MAG TPA: hypothetical protein EYP30_06740 [Archaeoglobaceae archaeon]|nr:hypothetical protein [Archaeoglobaceae archaeon]